MRYVSIADDCPRDRDRAFSIVSGLTDPPLVFRVPGVARDHISGLPFEATNAAWVPVGDLLMRQHLGLLADRVSGRDPDQATTNAIRGRVERILHGVR